MEIKWSNIVAFVLGIVALVIVWKAGPAIASFFGSMRDIGPGSPEEMATGLVAFALIAILIVAIVKILVSRK